jgi:dTDP-glucose 4,6-dehydratase
MKTVLLTGVGGFIGAHFLEHLYWNTDWKIIGLDSFYHKGTTSRLDDLSCWNHQLAQGMYDASYEPRIEILKHDLTVPFDPALIHRIELSTGKAWEDTDNGLLPTRYNGVYAIINLASNSAVERSISNPGECWLNNCEIALHMLELARKLKPQVFLQVSTDEVFGDYSGEGVGHHEWDTLLPSNPYAASKAAQEMLCQAYWRTYDLPVVICNTMNNIGERQDSEKFLPKLIEKISKGERVQIYTDDEGNVGSRVYLDAKDHARMVAGICDVWPVKYSDGTHDRPDKYNIAGDTELNNLEFAQLVAKIMDKPLDYELVRAKSARPGYDKRYLLDGSKLRKWNFGACTPLVDTVKRIVEHAKMKPWWIGA